MRNVLAITVLLFLLFFFITCENNPNPAAGTTVASTSPEFKELALKIKPHLDCKRVDCCFIDGVETSCALVNACLEAGFCKMVAAD